MNRPSHRELTGKIKQAGVAAEKGSIFPLEPLALAGDATELGYLVEDLKICTKSREVIDRLIT